MSQGFELLHSCPGGRSERGDMAEGLSSPRQRPVWSCYWIGVALRVTEIHPSTPGSPVTGVSSPGPRAPFRDRPCDVEIRRVLLSTNEIESLNARYRRGRRGSAALPYLWAARAQDPLPGHPRTEPQGTGQARWTMRWSPHWTRPPSASPTACRPPRTSRDERQKHHSSDRPGRRRRLQGVARVVPLGGCS